MVSQAGLSSGHIFSFISALLFAKLGKCIRYELNLRSDDYLNGGLTGFHDTGYACRFDHLIIHCGNVFYFQSQSCDAVVNACNVVLAAAAFQNGCCDCCEIIIASSIFFSASTSSSSLPGVFRSHFLIAKRNTK